jgi:hypothetical protein
MEIAGFAEGKPHNPVDDALAAGLCWVKLCIIKDPFKLIWLPGAREETKGTARFPLSDVGG